MRYCRTYHPTHFSTSEGGIKSKFFLQYRRENHKVVEMRLKSLDKREEEEVHSDQHEHQHPPLSSTSRVGRDKNLSLQERRECHEVL